MALRSVSSLPSDVDLAAMGIRSESRLISRWRPRTLGQLRDAEQDLVVNRNTLLSGGAAVTRSIYTVRGGNRLI